jgi:UDP-3-O-[3-hydroxymyristoyl] N-acetylglucosamine deacetylase
MRHQRTIKRKVTTKGIGLHSGKETELKLTPASEDTGIVFTRYDKDRGRSSCMNAFVSTVSDTRLSTNLACNNIEVRTVEHLLAALSGLGIDNVYIELTGPEVPILDGSALDFTALIIRAGIEKQSRRVSCIRITKPISISDDYSSISVYPYEGRKITCSIEYDHPLIRHESMSIDITEENFVKEIAPAKTFGFLKEVEILRAHGLARGGTLHNSIVLDEGDIINKNIVTFEDEFVRHKILDIVGDSSLLGMPIYGHIVAYRPGHTMNVRFLKEILDHLDSWEIITETEKTPSSYQNALVGV